MIILWKFHIFKALYQQSTECHRRLCNREIPCLYLKLETSHPYWYFRGFPQSLQANAGVAL
jgi:hypothetical protein